MIAKEFDTISKDDIDALVANGIPEGRSIEYKQQLPGNGDEDKKEFLADVSSFANAAGGDLIYGVVEKRDANGKPTGIPEKVEGLAGLNADTENRRLDEMIRAGIDPRIPGVRIRPINGFPSGPVLVVRVPKSWATPHMVVFKNLSRFFSRTSAGKYQLDVREIRSAFTMSGDLRKNITAFRTERLGRIIANEGSVSLPATPKLILHLVPLTILDPTAQVDLTLLFNDQNLVSPIQNYGYNTRINFDGFLNCGPSGRGDAYHGYVQVFRSGVFEAVDADVLTQPGGTKLVPSSLVERRTLDAVTSYLKVSKQLGIPLPIVVMITAHGLKGFGMATNSPWHNHRPAQLIDRDTLLLPDVLVEDFNTPPAKLLKPVFDAFWQSGGFPSCENYDDQGRWDGGQSQLPRGHS